jgi:glycine/D-amino acid oxidase-like deaminating enzyme
VGGGIAGLSAAWQLLRSGHDDFIVLELEPRAGGTSTYGTDGVVPYPWAAHYLPLPNREHASLCDLLDEMGVIERASSGEWVGREQDLVRDPEERIFAAGEWHEGLLPTPLMNEADFAQWKRFQEVVATYVRFRDARGRRAFTLPIAHCSDAAEIVSLDRVSAADWLSREGFRSKPLRWFLEYGCRDDYGTSLEQTSAWALIFYHAARVREPQGPSAPFLTWPEGNGRVVRHLARRIGARLEENKLALDVTQDGTSAKIVVLDARSERLEVIEAKHVILATPTFVTKHLVRSYRERVPSHFDAFSYSPWLVANLHLEGRPTSKGYPLAWDNVVYGGASLGYVVATHQTLDDDGRTVFTYYQPFVDSDPKLARYRLAAADHASAWDAVVAELTPAHTDLVSKVSRMDVWHWGHAMVRPVPGLIFGEARRRANESDGALHFAHTDLSGVALLDEAHFHGVRAANAVLARIRGG